MKIKWNNTWHVVILQSYLWFGFHCTLIRVKCTYFKKNWKSQLLYTPGIISCFKIHIKSTINIKLHRKPRNVCIHKSIHMHWHISVTERLNNVSGGGGAIELHNLNYVAKTLLYWNTLDWHRPTTSDTVSGWRIQASVDILFIPICVEDSECYLELIKCSKKDFLHRYVTMDETWIH